VHGLHKLRPKEPRYLLLDSSFTKKEPPLRVAP
jgi:hypothetical protein